MRDGFSGERALVIPQLIVRMLEAHPLTAALHITDIGHYPHAAHHFIERAQPIDQYVLIYCTDGAGSYTVNGRRWPVSADQYFILPAGVPHSYAADRDRPWTIYWVHFKGTLARQYAVRAAQPTAVPTEAGSRIACRNDLFEEIFTTLRAGYSTENLCYASSLFHHYLATLTCLTAYRAATGHPQPATDGRPTDAGIAAAAIHYMKENIEKRLTLSDIAGYTGYSASRFSALFRAATGHAPLAYFNLLKIQQACRLLDETDMRVNTISHKVGVDDAYYFTRLFSKVMGQSPTEYRLSKKG